MVEPFLGEIRMFAPTFAPTGWAFCNGQSMQITQNEALFSVLGTIYGGDGRTTFQLPDMRGRIPIHMGQGEALTNRSIGSQGGAETVTLTSDQIGSHTHTWQANNIEGSTETPINHALAVHATSTYQTDTSTDLVVMDSNMIGETGTASPVENRMPFLVINFIIALTGLIPSQT